MPIYEYRCSHCGHELEVLQKLSDAVLTDCPSCRGATLTKLVSAAGFQLKGSGWYATDFRNGSKPAAAKPAAAPTGEAKAETPSESKSESAAPAPAAGCGTGCACH
jgi:putative FmdB family regulatory protein